MKKKKIIVRRNLMEKLMLLKIVLMIISIFLAENSILKDQWKLKNVLLNAKKKMKKNQNLITMIVNSLFLVLLHNKTSTIILKTK
jgi:hypothetical protein